MPENWIRIGRVRSVHVAHRELRVIVEPGQEHQFGRTDWVRVLLPDASTLRCRIERFRWHAGAVLATLTPGVPRDAVAKMKGAAVVIATEERVPRPDGTWRTFELPGLRVEDENAAILGTVKDAYSTGANDVIELEMPSGRVVLLPAIDGVLISVRLDEGVVVVGDITPFTADDED